MSTNHVKPGDQTPSWLTDQASTAWAAGPAPSSSRSEPQTRAGAPVEPSSTARAPSPDPGPTAPVDLAQPSSQSCLADQPPPVPTPAPGPAPAGPQEFRPAWDDEDSVLSTAVRTRKSPPKQGWRAALYALTGGRVNPGLSDAEERLRGQLQSIRTPLPGPHSVVVGSIKGGVGKTTVSSLLGLALAEYRGDRVIAVDANPDAGTLGDRLVGEAQASKTTVRDLLDNIDQIRSSTQLSGYTHLAGRLQVLTSEQEPELSEMFSDTDYEAVLCLLAKFFEAIITDSGTGIVHSAMQGTLRHADSLVIVGAPTRDGASRASRTLQWLANHRDERSGELPYQQLARDAVVVLSCDRSSSQIDDSVIRDYFRARCRAVVELPKDLHLATGDIIDLDALTPVARDATLELAATVADGFQGRRTPGLASHGFRTEMPPR